MSDDIVDVIRAYGIELEGKSDNHLKGLCPWHEGETPALVVSRRRQFFRCYGCGVGGTAATFKHLMQEREAAE